MHDNKALGLIRLTDDDHRKEIEKNLEICLDDLYALVTAVEKHIDQFDGLVNRILYGVPFSGPVRSRGVNDRLTI